MTKEEDKSAIFSVFEAAGCRTLVELAEFLGIKQPSISNQHTNKNCGDMRTMADTTGL